MGESLRFRTWHAAVFLAAISAISVFSSSKDSRKYWRGLDQPIWTPPNWAFPTVRTGLNMLQVWADLRILNNRKMADRETLISLRAVNWLLYTVFTPAFFRTESPVASHAVTLAEGMTAGATLALLARRDPIAAAALTPLTLWTAYASVLRAKAASPDRLVDELRWEGAF